MKTAHKIVNNLINENIFPLKISSLRQGGWYLGIIYVKTHISLNIPVSIEIQHLLIC